MEINTQQPFPQSTNTPISPVNQQPVNVQQEEAKETGLKTESTVTLSAEAQKPSSSTEAGNNKAQITTKQEAQASVAQFQRDASNQPSLTQQAQNNDLTSTQVQRLIG